MKSIRNRFILFACICLIIATCLSEASIDVQASTPADKYVTAMPYAIGKGIYSTPIWEQHHFWKKHSSAANHGCGICVTAMALRLNGIPTDPNMVLKENKRSMKKCRPFKGPKAAAYIQSKGIKAVHFNSKKLKRGQCTNIMKQALNQGKVVMVVVQGRPFSSGIHWILLTGLTRDGRVIVANSSYGTDKICKKTKKQYQVVTWKQIQKKIVRFSKKWSSFIVVGNDF